MTNPHHTDAISWFRKAAPYINLHRDKVFVIMFSGEAIEHDNFKQLIHDFALLNSLGIKLVLVHGARPQINRNLTQHGLTTPIIKNLRVTCRPTLGAIMGAVGATRLKVEAMLTRGLGNSSFISERIDVVSGNYVIAKPYGVRNGVDYELTGKVRSIDTKAIHNNLQNKQIVLLGSVGYSTTGEVFNLLAEQVAVKTAVALQADKLIFIGKQDTHSDFSTKRDFTSDHIISQLTSITASLPVEFGRHIIGGAKACAQGVGRTHIVSYNDVDSLLNELFTRDGIGTLISANPFEEIQPATIDDVVGLINLLTPLEEKGILVKRSREKLEREISHFVVAKRDGAIIGCAALYPLKTATNTDHTTQNTSAEVACVAVAQEYRAHRYGEKLLQFLEKKSVAEGIDTLFVLTTQTAHWFVAHGFAEADATQLPPEKSYNSQRQSKVYIKSLS